MHSSVSYQPIATAFLYFMGFNHKRKGNSDLGHEYRKNETQLSAVYFWIIALIAIFHRNLENNAFLFVIYGII